MKRFLEGWVKYTNQKKRERVDGKKDGKTSELTNWNNITMCGK